MRRNGRALHTVPGPAESGGYAYALLFSTGTVQVGRTPDARAELGARRNTARSFGISLDDWWVSVPHEEWGGSERRLSAACRDLGGTRIGPGCWSGVDFGCLSEAADRLPPLTMTRLAGRRLWEEKPLSPDARMATAVRHRAEGLTVRQAATLLRVSHTTVIRDLARWDREGARMPLEIIRLSRPGTGTRNICRPDSTAAGPGVPAGRSSVTPLRRPA